MEKCWKPSKVSHQFLAGAISKEAKVVCFPHCEDQLLLIMKESTLEDQILYCEGKDGVNAYLWDRNFCWIVAGLRVGRVVRFIPKEICYYPPVEMLNPFYERAKEIRDNPASTVQEDAARRVQIRRELTRLIKSYIIEEDKRRERGGGIKFGACTTTGGNMSYQARIRMMPCDCSRSIGKMTGIICTSCAFIVVINALTKPWRFDMKLINECTWGDFNVFFVEHNNDFIVVSFEGEKKMFRVKQAKWNSKRDGFEFRATRKHFVCTNKVEGVMLFLHDACHAGVSVFNRSVILDMLDWAWYNMDTVSVKW